MTDEVTDELLERGDELRRAHTLIERSLSGEGAAIALVGPAGIGKSSLMGAVQENAYGQGMMVLVARGTVLDRDFAFGVARQILEPPLWGAAEGKRDELLVGAARAAAPLLGVEASGEQPAPSLDPSFAALHGLYWLTVNLAAQQPLLIAVDDAHWADQASLRWLAYLATRLEGVPALLTVAVRQPEPGVDEPLVETLLSTCAKNALSPRPLSEDAVGELVQGRLGPADPEFRRACHVATGGNPFLMEELLVELQHEGIDPSAGHAPMVLELGPTSIARAVLARLARLSPNCVRLARSLAVLGDGTTLGQAAELSDLHEEDAAAAADQLAAAAILRPSKRLEFVHPIVRSAVHAEILPWERAREHARAARIVAAAGAEGDRVAAHLLAAEPARDEWAFVQLRGAAEEAFERGAVEAAARYLERALREEPSDLEDRLAVLGLAGWIETLRNNEPRAIELLSAALELATQPEQRALIGRGLASACVVAARYVQAFEVLADVASDLGDEHRELGLRLEGELCVPGWFTLEARELVERRPKRFTPRAEDGVAGALLLGADALRECVFDGSAERAASEARKALFDGELIGRETADAPAIYMVICALAGTDELEAAREACEQAVAEASARGSLRGRATALCFLSGVNFRLGRMADAEADGRTFVGGQERGGIPPLVPCGLGFLIDALRERGQLEEAQEALEAEDVSAYAHGEELLFQLFLHARGRLRIARGDVHGGLRDLFECGRWEEEWGVHGTGLTTWRSDAAVALATRDDPDQARELAREGIERAKAYGARWPLGVALAAEGRVAGGDSGLDLLAEAVSVLERSPARLEHARALIELGAMLRRGGRPRDARGPLKQGLALARSCAGVALAERAYDELSATGARPRKILHSGVEALTASERRVAQMAADGMSNREIAEALFVTIHTVQSHLHRAFQKLEVSSREELPRVLRVE